VVAAGLNEYFGAAVTQIRTVGALSPGLPPLSAPNLSFGAVSQMLFPSLIITMLALTEAVSISRAIASRSGQVVEGNQEFIGQGLSNLLGAFFSGYASSGSFNRSGVNFAAGAKTPLAAVYASIFLLVIVLLVAPLAAHLPTAAMAGILFLVAWGLIDYHHIRQLQSISVQESVVLWVTLIGTLIDLEKGIFFGVALSLALYLYRTSQPRLESVVPDGDPTAYHYVSAGGSGHAECPQIKLARLNGSIYFGAVAHLQQQFQELQQAQPSQKHLVLMASGINFVDLAGAEFLGDLAKRYAAAGGGISFYRMKPSVIETLHAGGFMEEVGHGNLFPAGSRPAEALFERLDKSICADCSRRIFHGCTSMPGTPVQPHFAQ
jgi:SulP family sulfate permease